ncbi:hypothetical protein AB0B78_24860 [Streptomyces sp. NPDC040724]|uniref:hypothetical protein n=1 Tax=Streptomyces sp. NPDC040724 TaxID=3155612 RepID=UPI0033C8D5E0
MPWSGNSSPTTATCAVELRAATAGEDTGIVRARILSLLDTRLFARHCYVEYADAHAERLVRHLLDGVNDATDMDLFGY